jgi:hypothetical protein
MNRTHDTTICIDTDGGGMTRPDWIRASLYGQSATEQEAVDDLIAQLEEME